MSTIVAIFRRMVRIPAIPFSFAAVAAPFVQVSASAPGARIHLAKRKIDELNHQDALEQNVRKFICIGSRVKHLRYQCKDQKRAFDEVDTADTLLESPHKRQKLSPDGTIPFELEVALQKMIQAHEPVLKAALATWLASGTVPFPSWTSSTPSSQGSISKGTSVVSGSSSSSSSDGAPSSPGYLANSSETNPTSDEDEAAAQAVNSKIEENESEDGFSDGAEMLEYQEDEVLALCDEVHEELEQERAELGVTIRTINEEDPDLVADSGSEVASDDDSIASFDTDVTMTDGLWLGYIPGNALAEEALDLYEDLAPIERDDFLGHLGRGSFEDKFLVPALLEEVKQARDAGSASSGVDSAGYEADSEREDERSDPSSLAAAFAPPAFAFSSSAAAFGLSRR